MSWFDGYLIRLLTTPPSRTCAIVGGVLTVASIIDRGLFAANRALKSGGHVGGKLL